MSARLSAYVLLGLVMGCSSASQTGLRSSFWSPLRASAIAESGANRAGADKAGAIILRNKHTVEFTSNRRTGKPELVETREIALEVLRSGVEDLETVDVHYQASFDRLDEFRVVRRKGVTANPEAFTLKDAVDVPVHPDGQFFTDGRVAAIKLGPAAAGDIIHWRYVRRSSQPQLFASRDLFGGLYPEAAHEFEVIAPATWTLAHRVTQGPAVLDWEPAATVRGDRVVWTWSATDLPAHPPEAYAPGPSHINRIVSVQLQGWFEGEKAVLGIRDPGQASTYLRQLSLGSVYAEGEVAAVAREVAGARGAPADDKAAALYAWVRDNIDYCGVQLGVGGWRPAKASQTLSKRYGDCKAKATLLHAMLAQVGIESTLVAVDSGYSPSNAYSLPAPFANFNHQILRVDLPDGGVLCDPTSATTGFGRLPLADQGRLALPIVNKGGEIFHTPSPQSAQHTLDVSIELRATPGQVLSGELRAAGTGFWADQIRKYDRRASIGSKQDVFASLHLLSGARWANPDTEDSVPVEAAETRISARFKLAEGNSPAGEMVTLRASDILPDAIDSPTAKSRVLPFFLGPVSVVRYDVSIQLDAGSEFLKVPSGRVLETDEIRIDIEFVEVSPQEARLIRTVTIRDSFVESERYNELRDLLVQTRRAEAQPLVYR